MKQCDLVMKGGITSGIVYPGAVYELSREYEFVNIGGTSAGAIAAALTAAAEFRRRSAGDDRGFEVLRALPEWLAEDAHLVGLFQPAESMRPLYDAAVAWMETKNPLRAVAIVVKAFNRLASPVLAAGAFGVLVSAFAAWMLRGLWIAWMLAFLAIAIAAVTAIGCVAASSIEALLHAKDELPKNRFGICSGDVLTAWLDGKIREVSGLDRPLTFGDLESHGIHLEMMTTNLTQGRPYRLPAKTRRFFFSIDEMRALFPESVVQWLVEHSPSSKTLYAMPLDPDLPVIVATRMSLSFPVLLSAVPLWATDYGRRVPEDERALERCWFSDGGITSNFPVHFFDAPLPSRPTFAFNLATRTDRYHTGRQQVYVPRSQTGGIHELWSPIDSVPSFLGAIANTMQNWRDNMLLRVPGQRDRIAHVILAPKEGGLNLTMDPKTIRRVARKGCLAAAALRRRFDWSNHRWVRLRAFMYATEEALEKMTRAYDPSYDALFDDPPSYRATRKTREEMRNAMRNLIAYAQRDFAGAPFRTSEPPSPPAELRAMPRE